jgi:transcriptional repressor NrdR
MKCPYCGNIDDRVLDTRVQKDGSIRRRRECMECKARFSTMETLMLNFPMIIKKDGRREPFSKDKIFRGLQAASQKRPVSLNQIESVVERIASWVISRGENEISSRLIGKKVMAEVKQLDDVAYIRFASVYRTFKDVQEFVETLEDTELLDFVDSNNPQLSLTALREPAPTSNTNGKSENEHESNSAKTVPRTRPADPIPN